MFRFKKPLNPFSLARLSHAAAATGIAGLKGNNIVAIRRETKNRWERRAPLDPSHVRYLTRRGLKVIVQPSYMRYFTNQEYRAAGAEIKEDISEASVILGVKEVPIDLLIPNRTYVCFSHTIKAQPDNMPLLDAVLNKNIRMLDYECMVDKNGKRLVGFGRFAGNAGMIDLLRGLGDRLLGLGYSSPFLGMGYTDYVHSLAASKTSVQLVGHSLLVNGAPKDVAPLIFGFTGNGSVTKGALEIFQELPHEFVTVEELPEIAKTGDPRILYGVMLEREHLAAPIDPAKSFDKAHYMAHPEEYKPIFHEKVAPYISCLVNGMYWDARFPKLLNREQMLQLQRNGGRLLAIADISADPYGSIEFTKVCTKIDKPFLVYNPEDDSEKYDWEAEGVLLGSVDNLPAQLPKEASNHFGQQLLPFIIALANSDGSVPFEQQTDLPDELRNAVITAHGKLTPRFAYIEDLRKERLANSRRKSVLICGSGMVVAPCIEYLKSCGLDLDITVASADYVQAHELATRYDCHAAELNVSDKGSLKHSVEMQDLVISLVPAVLHATIAEACIDSGVNMVTTSYISPEMAALDQKAKANGIVIMNEIGLDPGIDHLSALKVIHEVQNQGGKVDSFVSYCGGLPAPQFSNNPLGYKFSWSPRGVLSAGQNASRFRMEGKVVETKRGELFKHAVPLDMFTGFSLEGLPNRDSIMYEPLYNLTGVNTMLRGTLRYKGFSETMLALSDMGIFNEAPVDALQKGDKADMKWNDLMHEVLKVTPDDLQKYSPAVAKKIMDLELFSAHKVIKADTPIDTFCELLKEKLAYKKGERDMVLLNHQFGIEWKNGRKEMRRSMLYREGHENRSPHTAMALTVGVPCGIASEYVLTGQMKEKGVLRPLKPDVYNHILKKLADQGIVFHEEVQNVY